MPEATPPPEASPLAALRERGVDGRDPVRFRLAEALARRAAAHAGAARRVLDARVAALVQALVQAQAQADAGDAAPSRPAAESPTPGPLARLVAEAARGRLASVLPAPAVARDPAAAAPPTGPAADPKTLQFFKRTWSRLSATQRLAQSRAALPENAGPLNSQHLVHRALTLMQQLSPEYLEHFVAHVDALQWLEQANDAAAQELAGATRPAAGRRSLPARR